MKYILIISFIFLSCKKSENKSITNPDEIKYEVILENAQTWHGTFLNENAQVISVENATSGWSYTFININNVIAPTLLAYPDFISNNSDCVMKIKKNGNVVASGRSSISPMIQYLYP